MYVTNGIFCSCACVADMLRENEALAESYECDLTLHFFSEIQTVFEINNLEN